MMLAVGEPEQVADQDEQEQRPEQRQVVVSPVDVPGRVQVRARRRVGAAGLLPGLFVVRLGPVRRAVVVVVVRVLVGDRRAGDLVPDEQEQPFDRVRPEAAGRVAVPQPADDRHDEEDHQSGGDQLQEHELGEAVREEWLQDGRDLLGAGEVEPPPDGLKDVEPGGIFDVV
jgi:hypothetical protein